MCLDPLNRQFQFRYTLFQLVMEPGVPGMPPEVNDQELSLLILLDFTDDDKGDYDVERFEFRTLESKYGCLNDQFLDRNTVSTSTFVTNK